MHKKKHCILTIRMKNHYTNNCHKNHHILAIRMKTITETIFIRTVIQTIYDFL